MFLPKGTCKTQKVCYNYDELSRVVLKTVRNVTTDAFIFSESYTYDAAGNITDAPDSCFLYDTNNRLVIFEGRSVSYDLDGNMTYDGV